jgi:hypothetical protein
LKSIQIFSSPFFLGTITMGDNNVASSTNWINPTTITCLYIVWLL